MENGSFHTKLGAIDFEADDFSLQQNTQIKPIDKINQEAFQLPPIPSSFSSSVDSLLRQNEDLSARLKITTQRLIQFESSLQTETEKNKNLVSLQSNHQDQLLVWKEKERLWLEKLEIAEQRTQALEERFPEYLQLQTDLQRYKKYHEKVKTQVKPYIQQLKEYSKGLVSEIRELHRELSNQELKLNRAEKRGAELASELKLQMKAHDSSAQETQASHRNEINFLQSQIQGLKENNIILENKSQRLDQTLARQDELNNIVIEHKRRLQDIEAKFAQDTEGLRQSLQIARNDLRKKNLMIEDFGEKTQKTEAETMQLRTEIQNLNDQMTSLRYLWTEKTSEVEQLKASLEALEKINRELSQKLMNFRTGQAQL